MCCELGGISVCVCVVVKDRIWLRVGSLFMDCHIIPFALNRGGRKKQVYIYELESDKLYVLLKTPHNQRGLFKARQANLDHLDG